MGNSFLKSLWNSLNSYSLHQSFDRNSPLIFIYINFERKWKSSNFNAIKEPHLCVGDKIAVTIKRVPSRVDKIFVASKNQKSMIDNTTSKRFLQVSNYEDSESIRIKIKFHGHKVCIIKNRTGSLRYYKFIFWFIKIGLYSVNLWYSYAKNEVQQVQICCPKLEIFTKM